jgi:hypothetical protein
MLASQLSKVTPVFPSHSHIFCVLLLLLTFVGVLSLVPAPLSPVGHPARTLASPMGPSTSSSKDVFTFLDRTIGLIVPFLRDSEVKMLDSLHPEYCCLRQFGSAPLVNPFTAVLRRRLRKGFGKPSASRSVTNDRVPYQLAIHFAWEFLTPRDRLAVATADRTGAIFQYAELRQSIPFRTLHQLRLPRTDPSLASMSLNQRSALLGAAFIAVDCHVGNLLRCLGPEFTQELRDVESELQSIDDLHLPDPPPGAPPVDLDMAKEILRDGVPLRGHFECPLYSTQRRLLYDNHPPLKAVENEVRAKFEKEEQKCYHLLLPRFLAWFVFGLFISPISWVWKRNKGRIVIDSSTKLGPSDDGAPNAQIPAPSNENYRDNPPVHYQSAWTRYLVHIYKLRTNWPLDEILMHIDDIEAAFRRLLYHPDLAAVFASVFMEFLVIPVGMIFGSRNSPSYYCILGELRSHIASVATLDHIPVPAEWTVKLPPDLTEEERNNLVQVGSDPLYKVPAPPEDGTFIQAAFVDDSGKAERYRRILEAIRNSVASAFLIFGFPKDDWRGACFAIDKWLSEASHEVTYLGFSINSREMTVAWPTEKRIALAQIIRSTLPPSRTDRRKKKPVEFAIILGHLRSPATLAPALAYISLRIQLWFNEQVRINKAHAGKSRWWRLERLQVPAFVWHDLRLLLEVLDKTEPSDPFWCRPIGMLIPRTTTHFAYQDASYEGLGGFSEEFGFSWRLSRDELEAVAIPMPDLPMDMDLPLPDDSTPTVDSVLFDEIEGEDTAPATHINVLEFVAAIINYWFVLARTTVSEEPVGGWIVGILGDNTSALSWMRHSARARSLIVQRLSRLFVRLPILFDFQGKITAGHIAGANNVIADALSRPLTVAPSWESVMQQHSVLQQFPAYQVPPQLLSIISILMSPNKAEELFETPMMELSTVELDSFVIG